MVFHSSRAPGISLYMGPCRSAAGKTLRDANSGPGPSPHPADLWPAPEKDRPPDRELSPGWRKCLALQSQAAFHLIPLEPADLEGRRWGIIHENINPSSGPDHYTCFDPFFSSCARVANP